MVRGGSRGLIFVEVKPFRIIPVHISLFMGVASSGGLWLMNILIFIKCMTGVSFLHRARELLTEVSFGRQKCLFTDRSDLFFGTKTEVSFYTNFFDRSVFFPIFFWTKPNLVLFIAELYHSAIIVASLATNYFILNTPALTAGKQLPKVDKVLKFRIRNKNH